MFFEHLADASAAALKRLFVTSAFHWTSFRGCLFIDCPIEVKNIPLFMAGVLHVTCFRLVANVYSLRKTFGRQVYNMNSDNSELALVKLMELFNHSSVSITKRYLGLRREEILQVYDYLTF